MRTYALTLFFLLLPVFVFAQDQSKDIDVLKTNVIELTNEVREKEGLKPLLVSDTLSISAQSKSDHMVTHDYFSHIGPQGETFSTFLKNTDFIYDKAGENLALGKDDMSLVMKQWLASKKHRKNIVDSRFDHIGIGIAQKNDGTYAITQHFGRERNRAALPAIPTFISAGDSYVTWEADGAQTKFFGYVKVLLPVKGVRVQLLGEEHILEQMSEHIYDAEFIMSGSPDELFSNALLPTVLIELENDRLAASLLELGAKQEGPLAYIDEYEENKKIFKGSIFNVYTTIRWLFSSLLAVYLVALVLYTIYGIFNWGKLRKEIK